MLPSNTVPLTVRAFPRITVEFNRFTVIYIPLIYWDPNLDDQALGGLGNDDVDFSAVLQQRFKVS